MGTQKISGNFLEIPRSPETFIYKAFEQIPENSLNSEIPRAVFWRTSLVIENEEIAQTVYIYIYVSGDDFPVPAP